MVVRPTGREAHADRREEHRCAPTNQYDPYICWHGLLPLLRNKLVLDRVQRLPFGLPKQ
jgi:hypothetical protein